MSPLNAALFVRDRPASPQAAIYEVGGRVSSKRLRGGAPAAMRVLYRGVFEHVADARVAPHGLPGPFRYLIYLGYLATFGLLLAVLLAEMGGPTGAQLVYESSGELLQIPVLTLASATAGLALGWAFLLTGATDAGRPLVLPMLALLVLQSMMLHPRTAVVDLVVVVGAAVFYIRSHRDVAAWRLRPALEFLGWFVACGGLIAYPWLLGDAQGAAAGADVATQLLAVLALPMWVAFGLDTVDLATRITRLIVINLAERVGDRALLPGVVILAFAMLVGPGVGLYLAGDAGSESVTYGWLAFTMFGSLIILMCSGVVIALRRWSRASATIGLAALVFVTVVALAVSVTIYAGRGLDQAALDAIGLVAPSVTLAVLLVYSVLTFVPRITDTDGRRIGRPGRVLLYFGYVLSVLGASAFQLGVIGRSDEGFRFLDFVDDSYVIGLVLLGIPYTLWLLFRRKDRLVGSAR